MPRIRVGWCLAPGKFVRSIWTISKFSVLEKKTARCDSIELKNLIVNNGPGDYCDHSKAAGLLLAAKL